MNDDEWYAFLQSASLEFDAGWWTAREAVDRVRTLPASVEISVQRGGSSNKSLGKLLAARRGRFRDLVLESSGSNQKKGLYWRIVPDLI